MVVCRLVHGFILRMIETMPMGETGHLDLQPFKQRLRPCFGLVDGQF